MEKNMETTMMGLNRVRVWGLGLGVREGFQADTSRKNCSGASGPGYLGYCPHPVTVYIRGPIKGYI